MLWSHSTEKMFFESFVQKNATQILPVQYRMRQFVISQQAYTPDTMPIKKVCET